MNSKTYNFKMKDFRRFTSGMTKRLKMGDKRYKDDWINRDLIKDMEEELLDIANYSYLLYRKLRMKKR